MLKMVRYGRMFLPLPPCAWMYGRSAEMRVCARLHRCSQIPVSGGEGVAGKHEKGCN